uniref:Uncharacterized protein n=1 Tax=Avena sativa TaxID=4498 RepID=A0ACD5Z0V9_AVESA
MPILMCMYARLSYLSLLHFIPKEMGVLKVPILLRLLVLILFVLVHGYEAKTCNVPSKTYNTWRCKQDPCDDACQKEGFAEGQCFLFRARPYIMRCLCKKVC